MKIAIDGRTIPLKNLDTARIRDVAELQRQTGWKLQEVRSQSNDSEVTAAAVVLFLSMHNAGAGISWDDILDRGMDEFSIVYEPGDVARAMEDDDASEPAHEPSGEADADPVEEEWPPRVE